MIYEEIDKQDFEPWGGAVSWWDEYNSDERDQLLDIICESYSDEYGNISITQINDIIWFEPEWCFEVLDKDFSEFL